MSLGIVGSAVFRPAASMAIMIFKVIFGRLPQRGFAVIALPKNRFRQDFIGFGLQNYSSILGPM